MFGFSKKADQELVAKKQQESSREKIASIRPYRNHRLYKIDKKTLEVVEAKLDTQPARFAKEGKQTKRSEVTIEEGFLYVSAMNKKNAIKKLMKMIKQKSA